MTAQVHTLVKTITRYGGKTSARFLANGGFGSARGSIRWWWYALAEARHRDRKLMGIDRAWVLAAHKQEHI